MKEKFKKAFLAVNWLKIVHYVVISFCLFYVNFYLVNVSLLKGHTDKLPNQFTALMDFNRIAYIISIFGIAIYLSRYIKKQFFIELTVGYLAFTHISYFIVVTRNLNNYKFNWWDFSQNDFFQYYFLTTLILIIGLAVIIFYVFDRIQNKKRLEAFFADFDYPFILSTGLIASFAVNGNLFLEMLAEKVAHFIKDGNYAEYLLNVIGSVAITLILCSALVYFALQSYIPLKENRPNYSIAVLASFFLGLIFNYSFQYGIRSDGMILDRYIFPSATLFQIFVIALFNLLLYMVVNRILRTTAFIIILGVVITVANSIKFSMRNEPLLFSDLSWIKEIRLIMSYIDITLVIYSLLGLAVAMVLFYLFRNRLLRGTITNSRTLRLTTVLAIVTVFSYVFVVFSQQENGDIAKRIPVLSKLNNYENIEWMGHATVARERSLTFVWLKQMTSKKMERPDRYSQKTIAEIVEKYTKKAQEINASRTNNISEQTVIYVLSESFSDPTRISNVTLTTDPIPIIRSIKESTTSGLMKSDGYGGGTANMEFETLTGLPMYNLSSSVSTLYTDVVPQMTYFPSISDFYASENKYAIHLGDATTYSRKEVYRELGFNTFIAESNGTEKAVHLEHYGVYPS
ncbi:sulfatase-like hydrolase/transferase [Streptococcus anginosus]|uniref:sulfatase-like hydrolase/transferase n=1 Tax=Streptococcus anginosus TaxID=1328 RepID=UPI003081491C